MDRVKKSQLRTQKQEKARKPFVEPRIERQAKLPEVTNSFIGSFNP